jgi:hypothetical protein
MGAIVHSARGYARLGQEVRHLAHVEPRLPLCAACSSSRRRIELSRQLATKRYRIWRQDLGELAGVTGPVISTPAWRV